MKHGRMSQEVFDQLGVVRENTDSIRSIAVLGTSTFGWTYTRWRNTARAHAFC